MYYCKYHNVSSDSQWIYLKLTFGTLVAWGCSTLTRHRANQHMFVCFTHLHSTHYVNTNIYIWPQLVCLVLIKMCKIYWEKLWEMGVCAIYRLPFLVGETDWLSDSGTGGLVDTCVSMGSMVWHSCISMSTIVLSKSGPTTKQPIWQPPTIK